MLEDFESYHVAQEKEVHDWMESTAFVIAVPLAYVAAVVIAVAVALIAPEDTTQRAQAVGAMQAAAR